ncbi:hypothetical protein MRX96_022871 [Rhipicephalus microplus]
MTGDDQAPFMRGGLGGALAAEGAPLYNNTTHEGSRACENGDDRLQGSPGFRRRRRLLEEGLLLPTPALTPPARLGPSPGSGVAHAP